MASHRIGADRRSGKNGLLKMMNNGDDGKRMERLQYDKYGGLEVVRLSAFDLPLRTAEEEAIITF